VIRPAYFVLARGSSHPVASALATSKPMLWRVPAYCVPGLPSPTISQSAGSVT
jgi:hypothetical protein